MVAELAPVEICVCPPAERRAVLVRLLFPAPEPNSALEPRPARGRGPADGEDAPHHWQGQQVDRLLDDASPAALQGLLVARRGARIVGAAWAQVHPGSTATVWPAWLAADESESTAVELMTRVEGLLTESKVAIAQALTEQPTGTVAERLAMAGLVHATDLVYLAAERALQPLEPPRSNLACRPCSREGRGELQAVVERTYLGSLDCPNVHGARSLDDVLLGYESIGVDTPDRWLLIERVTSGERGASGEQGATSAAEPRRPAGEPVGCLILADHPHFDQLEIVYMGVLPEQRGRGVGKEICQWALWHARQARRAQLVVAADAQNQPAVSMYLSAGFKIWERRCVFLRLLPSAPRDGL